MTAQDQRERVAEMIAEAAIEGQALSLCTFAYALDLGLDVEAIENNPHEHLRYREDA